MATEERGAVFALLDDCNATATRRSSRLYTGFAHERVCTDAAQLEAVCDSVAADMRDGLHAVVLAGYEFGRMLVGIDALRPHKTQHGDATLRFLLFERCSKLSRDDVDAWLAGEDGGAGEPSVAGIAELRASVDFEQFDAAIDAIQTALRDGDSYQVNYTYRLDFDVFGSPPALYRRLRARQPVPFGALIALRDGTWVLSCSPELFVEKHGDTLRARPMKGTAPRADDPLADRRAAAFLAGDPKNRAENVMIVDLLRNDLSRIAQTGSVNVPALFAVEAYPSVWQMTSTVEAALRPGTSFAGVLRALFPCGSITGAPKHRTMQLIDALESTPRGLYTGAIGWLDAPPPSQPSECGDFCMSVAIRTLSLHRSARTGALQGELGIGAGIVLDSVAADEYAECQLKARFLTDAPPGFDLFETMYATREDGVRHLPRHLARLANSAAALGFRWDGPQALQAQLDAHCRALPPRTPHRMRLALSKDGSLQITSAVLAALTGSTVGVLLATEQTFAATMQAADPLLRHKTTRRADYDRGWREAEAKGAFDTLFFNERGELTEGGRTNVFVKLAGRWWTPPLASGVLPGVMRSVLLEDASGLNAQERVLSAADVTNADALLVCNALRGALPAQVVR